VKPCTCAIKNLFQLLCDRLRDSASLPIQDSRLAATQPYAGPSEIEAADGPAPCDPSETSPFCVISSPWAPSQRAIAKIPAWYPPTTSCPIFPWPWGAEQPDQCLAAITLRPDALGVRITSHGLICTRAYSAVVLQHHEVSRHSSVSHGYSVLESEGLEQGLWEITAIPTCDAGQGWPVVR